MTGRDGEGTERTTGHAGPRSDHASRPDRRHPGHPGTRSHHGSRPQEGPARSGGEPRPHETHGRAVRFERRIPFERVFNFRDVGGYRGADGRTVRWRRLFRSDALSGLTEADRERFLALGIRTVVDLRRPYEIAAAGRVPDWDGLVYRHLDPPHPEWVSNPYRDGMSLTRYLADRYHELIEHGARRLVEAIGVIADESAAPTVVHCVAGKDRTGVVCALTLSLLGVSDADIDADYALSTAGSQRYVDWARANGRSDVVMKAWWRSPPGTMALFLSELRQRYGSVERPLRDAGLSRGDIAALRRHLLA
ncbi:MAG: tyrosine-protein phosphatase [Micromonosporaceae bacterium]|jgi:protein-tyrosine phosphatase